MNDEGLEILRHNCGLCVAHTLHDAYSFIKSLQHRGREAAGIAAIGEERIDVIKWLGRVNKFEIEDLYQVFPGHKYHTYLAHVRYATSGKKEKTLIEEAHPQVVGGRVEDKETHIMILDCEMVGVHNGQVGSKYLKDINPSVRQTECDTEALLHFYKEKGEYEILRQIPGAYTIAIGDKKRKEVIILRDRTGIRPGVLGQKDGKYGVASEDIAFRKNGGRFTEDLEPGITYYLHASGSYRTEKVVDPHPRYCFFEWNYLADVDSVLNGISVERLRKALGVVLANESVVSGAEADSRPMVTFMPRCPEVAARSYAKKTGLPFKLIFYKMRSDRSFMGPDPEERKHSIEENLYLLPHSEYLKDKNLIIIDDSIVRGNNAKRARYLAYNEAQVKSAQLQSYTPPMGIIGEDGVPRGCLFGVDMPPDDDFVVRDKVLGQNRTFGQIGEKIKMPVGYISLKGMLMVFEELGLSSENLCTYCIGGEHPFKPWE